MSRPVGRRAQQRVVTLALEVLDRAAYRSSKHKVDTLEVRLALGALWLILREKAGIHAYWTRAQLGETKPWDTCRWPYYHIAKNLRDEGWDAPVDRLPPRRDYT